MENTIGSIVALNTHPFFTGANKDLVVISGDTSTISPLMVITEILLESKSLFDENVGDQIVKKGSFQYKCLWYSSKYGQFEDAWFSSRLIRFLEINDNSVGNKQFSYGKSVGFKTLNIELGKKKSTLNYADDFSKKETKTIAAMLTFSSPVMQIIGFVKSDSKEPLIDHKTGEEKRKISSQLVKCKYYNSISDKFSEVLIPIEALVVNVAINNETLNKLDTSIRDKCFFEVKSESLLFKRTIVKPLKINYKSGNYYLEAEDYLENRIIEILITPGISDYKIIDYKFDQLPNFILGKSKRLNIDWLNKETLEALPQNMYWRIKYKDYNDKVTSRTIYSPTYFVERIKDETKKFKSIDYVAAKCIRSNNEERYFRIDRIQKLEVIDIEVSENMK